MKHILFLLTIGAFCLNCAGGSFTKTGKTYPALSETADVEIVLRSKPNYNYEVIGMASVFGGSDEQQFEKAKVLARKNGGDVVLLTTETTDNAGNKSRTFEVAKKTK